MASRLHLLTFLGARPLEETTYTWRGFTHTASAAPLATTAFLRPSRVSVFLTAQARQATYPAFERAFKQAFADTVLQPIDITVGKNEQELWALFERMSDTILEAPEREIALDITHGFRSLPILALLAATYTQAAFAVRVQAALYGALDATQNGQTPMFDLSPMLTLLEWAVAADRFNRTGDARYLASLLGQAQKRLAQGLQHDQEAIAQQVAPLGRLRSGLKHLSQALAVVRPDEVAEGAARLPEHIEQARRGLAVAASAQPFQQLLDTIARSYQPLGLAEPAQASPRERLAAQRALVRWYLEREHWVQAITLARELLVNWVMAHLGLPSWEDLDERQRVEQVINAEAARMVKAKKARSAQPEARQPFRSLFLGQVPQVEQLLGLWKDLADKRNDIDHAGMRPKPESASTLIQAVQRLVEQVLTLTEPMGDNL